MLNVDLAVSIIRTFDKGLSDLPATKGYTCQRSLFELTNSKENIYVLEHVCASCSSFTLGVNYGYFILIVQDSNLHKYVK